MAISKIDPDGLNVGQIGGRRNVLINGACKVSQRGTQSLSTDNYTACDRFKYDTGGSIAAVFNTTQAGDGPDGFSNSLKLDCTTADTVTSTEHCNIRYKIEAQNVQHFAYGTSNAKTTTLSFWVKSNQTSTFSVAFFSEDSTRVIGSTYTISAADTWEYKTITFAGDASGSINDDVGVGLEFIFGLQVGSTLKDTDNTSWGSYVGGKFGYGHTATIGASTDDYWQITGVQLEVGDTATPFEHRSYGEELALCQRYYQKIGEPKYSCVETGGYTARRCGLTFPVPMRTSPTFSISGTLRFYNGGGTCTANNSSISSSWTTPQSMDWDSNITSAMASKAQGNACVSYTTNTGTVEGYAILDAEL